MWAILRRALRLGQRTEPEARPGTVLTIVFRQGEDGYVVAECLQIPGCMSQGRTQNEALSNIIDAIESCLAVKLLEFFRQAPLSQTDFAGIQTQESVRVNPPRLEPIHA